VNIDPKKLRIILVGMNLLSEKQFADAEKLAARTRRPLSDVLVSKNYLTEDQLVQLIAEQEKLPHVKLSDQKITEDVLNLLPEKVARDKMAIPFAKDKSKVKVAMTDPTDLETINYIRKKAGLEVEPYLAADGDINKALMLYRRGLYKDFAKVIDQNVSQLGTAGVENVAQAIEQMPVVKIIDSLIEYAIAEDASDIHIEPQGEQVIVRFRVDGRLRDVLELPQLALAPIVARIKYLTNLKIDEHRKPQDGRFKKEIEGSRFSFRVSIIPAYHGEKIVIRILPEEAKRFSLEDLGLDGKNLDIVKGVIKSPNGMLLVTGPTGSGKTTTLYTILQMLNQEDVNISTVEDPIEYGMDRVNQIQVNPGVGISFANGLRSILRQDPDIIMIGEIRDSETAEIAIHSALTGHLVLSTLHTNDAAGTLPRLIDMGVEPFLIASTVNVAIAQRLVRKLCPHCMESYQIDMKSLVSRDKSVDFEGALKHLADQGLVAKGEMKKLRFYRGKGCKQCGDSGYRGRIGIFEVLEISDDIRELIVDRKDSSVIAQRAIDNGMGTMLEDGIQKAFEGKTSIDEVLRVVATPDVLL
jgi:type IV pilus assembly protein PilB